MRARLRTAWMSTRLGLGRYCLRTPHDSHATDRLQPVTTEARRQAKHLSEGTGFMLKKCTASLRHAAHHLKVLMLTASGQELCGAVTAAGYLVDPRVPEMLARLKLRNCSARGARQVTMGKTGWWKASVQSGVVFVLL